MNSQIFVSAFPLYFDLFFLMSISDRENVSNPILFPKRKMPHVHIHAKSSSSFLCSSSYRIHTEFGQATHSTLCGFCTASVLPILQQPAIVGCPGQWPGSCDLSFLCMPDTCQAPPTGDFATKSRK